MYLDIPISVFPRLWLFKAEEQQNWNTLQVNNAGISGVSLNPDVFQRATELSGGWPDGKQITWDRMATQNFDMVQQCIQTNYYGARRMTEALVPLLELSDSARIVNISSSLGLLQFIPSEWAKQWLNDLENLTEERVDEVVNKFLKDFQEGMLETNGWPLHFSAYRVSKAALNAYTRIVAKRYPSFCVNCVCPGFCKTDIVANVGLCTPAQGAEKPVMLALLPNHGPSGIFFSEMGSSCF
uniref:(+)-neomenthol dehydrogenase n=1 Tax=Rhizophora mucronata TaxID=61149 RepID=A0A2P2JTI2_RHIMU